MYNSLSQTKALIDELNSFFPTHRSIGAIGIQSLSSSIVSKQVDDKLEVAVLVAGHDPKNVKVELTESTIHIKAEKETDGVESAFIPQLDETLRLRKDFDGLTAKAKIENGILKITVDKKEEAKPKKLSISF